MNGNYLVYKCPPHIEHMFYVIHVIVLLEILLTGKIMYQNCFACLLFSCSILFALSFLFLYYTSLRLPVTAAGSAHITQQFVSVAAVYLYPTHCYLYIKILSRFSCWPCAAKCYRQSLLYFILAVKFALYHAMQIWAMFTPMTLRYFELLVYGSRDFPIRP